LAHTEGSGAVKVLAQGADSARVSNAAQVRVDTLRDAVLRRVLEAAGGPERPDNLDWLVHPSGPPQPDPAAAAARLAALLDDLGPFARTFDLLVDDQARRTMVNVLAQRVLGPARVVLDLEPYAYREVFARLHTRCLTTIGAVQQPYTPLEWTINAFDLRGLGIPVTVAGNGLPVAQTFLLGQYALRHDRTVGPWPGDHALDIGACWGETALWLANAVGTGGRVLGFEPAPVNRQVLDANLAANPEIAPRITILPDLVGRRDSGPVAFPLAGAGAQAVAIEDAGTLKGHLTLRPTALDDLLDARGRDRVDFVKIDVEGAELDVLAGAVEMLERDRPRLAIAIYHRPDDLATIPAFLDDLGLGYGFHLQASTLCEIDCVLFAVPPGP
jgi:FkbM family methyltransferase